MLSRRQKFAVSATALFSTLLLSGALASADDVVGRVKGASQGLFAGKPRPILSILAAQGNKPMQVGLPLIDDANPQKGAREDMVTLVKGFKPGDYVKITYAMAGAPPGAVMSAIVPYTLKPGEEEANAFIFAQTYDRREGKQTYTMVDVRKFEQPLTLMIPNHKDKNGDMSADPEMAATVGALKEGDVILVDAVNTQPKPSIKHIELYTAPQSGKVVKIDDPADLDGNKTASVDIDADGKTITAFVPGKIDGKKFTVDNKVMGELKKVHKDGEVTFRTTDENGKTFLRAIAPAKGAAHAAAGSSTEKEKPETKPAK